MDNHLNFIYFNSLDEIFNNYNEIENSKVGSNSHIFMIPNSRVIKLFKDPPTELHLEILNYFNKKYNGSLFLKPLKFIKINDKICGYILKYCKGCMLEDLDDNILLNVLFDSFSNLGKEIEGISLNNIYMDDISPRNIMYENNKKKVSIIDYDNYRFMDINTKNLYIRNMGDTLQTIIFAFIQKYEKNDIGYFSRNMILEGYSIKECLYHIKNYVENEIQQNINTVGDLKEQSHILLKLK